MDTTPESIDVPMDPDDASAKRVDAFFAWYDSQLAAGLTHDEIYALTATKTTTQH